MGPITKTKKSIVPERLLVLLTLLVVVISPFASDSYTPSLPAMAKAMGSSTTQMQLTMTSYLIGLAVSQLIYGPLSDRHGRRPIMLIGLIITVIGSLLCAFATSVTFIIFARSIQGIGAGVSNGLFRALLRDQFSGHKLSQVGSYAGMVYTIAFALAPVLGGYIQLIFDWRANFIFVALVVTIILIILWLLLPETHLKRDVNATKFKNILRNYFYLLRSPAFVGYTLISSLALSGFIAYYTAAPFILENVVGLSPEQFGLLSLGIAAGLFLGMIINVRLVVTKGVTYLLFVGIIMMVISGLAMLTTSVFNILNTFSIIIPIIIFGIASAFVFTNAMTSAFHHVGHIAGVAGGMYGFIQVIGASITSILVARLSETTQLPLASVLTGISFVALLLFYLLKKVDMKK